MKTLFATFCAVLLTIALAYIGYFAYVLHEWEKPLAEFEVKNGGLGDFLVGERKEEILQRLPNWSYSPQPKPAECPQNWITPKEMTDVQHSCLVKSDLWDLSHTNASPCPVRSDEHASLRFEQGRVKTIKVVCTRAK
ncbi:hypothetical protein [Methylobacter tundripaludum]|uniref:hypothetical protein n=1 Tax=Methylobacter tundripaludum TaxID=173365 RepID=UPI0004894F6B|nr:hypothetical protein [Methylobacter tundripaludum]